MRYSRLVMTLAVLPALGCWTTGPAGLKAELQTARTTFAQGDTFKGTFTIRNIRAFPVRTELRAPPAYELDVYDENDSLVLMFPDVRLDEVTELELGPWGSASYDMGFALCTDPGLEPLPVGNYRIRARLFYYPEPHDDLTIRVE